MKKTPHDRKGKPGPKQLGAILTRCGVSLAPEQIHRLWAYHQLLRKHNEELNLTRIHNFENMVEKLYADSILPGLMITLPSPLLDLGTGPGMPGIPLKIAFPHLQVILAEARGKRVDFLRKALDELGLEGMRAEGGLITASFSEPVRGVITRAVESIGETLTRIEGCLCQGGLAIFMKGPRCDQEVAEAIGNFAGRFELQQDMAYTIPGTPHERRLVVFRRLTQRPGQVRKVFEGRGRHKRVASSANAHFKRLKRILTAKGIRKEGTALVSGDKLVRDVIQRHVDRVRTWISWPGGAVPPEGLPDQVLWIELEKSLFRELDVFGTGAPLLEIGAPPLEPWDPGSPLPAGVTLLVPFQDPENVGAVLRSAVAFGVRAVVILKEGASPFHPKALRASAGAALDVRLYRGPGLKDLSPELPLIPLSREGKPLDRAVFPETLAILPGVEGPGLPEAWRQRALSIPMTDRVDSLNAASAVAIALYEWSRRRRAEEEKTRAPEKV
ncbi:16S rRNA m(7)G-527 methyltransferase [Desulfacinum hydrothermale DSM 13146]|uniref:Ribosomal RNA small subunit methyltransferase G n=1 Tax=Desulfacinum hydrothermale DSM 13146 TaxID=1121390 RepID=A0A1W1XGJ6_9BACT|nr:RsmG family class I SAM-dependent methyltransferase [Desulfacinum hydrothermale]SMC23079.1 16S rRNA m(7)G-527 methyltransferase [Desulfacinum hydrothermale DSM 13146]